MKLSKIKGIFFALSLCCSSTFLLASEKTISQLVDAVNGTFDEKSREAGKKAKLRNHAKGFCTSGSFVPNMAIKNDFNIPILGLAKMDVIARFSLGGGNPHQSDKTSGRFMSLTITGNNESIGFVTTNVPFFFAKNMEDFYSFQVKIKQGAKGKQWLMENHAEGKAFLTYVGKMKATSSYANNIYYGVNSFLFDTKEGTKVAGRWIFEPVQTETMGNKAPLSDNFLEKELINRIKKQPIKWNLYIQLAQKNDDILNPAISWPDSREKVLLGQLTIDGLSDNKEEVSQCANNIFNPTLLPKGVSISDDPILKVRTPAYIESLIRRF